MTERNQICNRPSLVEKKVQIESRVDLFGFSFFPRLFGFRCRSQQQQQYRIRIINNCKITVRMAARRVDDQRDRALWWCIRYLHTCSGYSNDVHTQNSRVHHYIFTNYTDSQRAFNDLFSDTNNATDRQQNYVLLHTPIIHKYCAAFRVQRMYDRGYQNACQILKNDQANNLYKIYLCARTDLHAK